ncbi:MAG: chemotaxis protein CheB, partial [Pirellulaceae bacterium]
GMGKKSRKQSDKSSPGGKAAKVGQAAQTGKQSSASRQAKRSSSAKQTSAKPSDARSDDFPIVGVGASAGGLEALKGLLDAIPDEPGVALVVIQHLDPTKSSLTAELLDKHTKMEVTQVDNDVVVHVNHVYVIPPNKSLDIQAGKLQLSDPRQRRGVRVPIDIFLRSLADDQGERAVAVILSGTGSDGTLGAKAVKTAGGLVIAQQPESAGHPGMPQSVIETGIVDQVLPPSKISKVLVAYAQHSFMRTPQDESKQVGSSRADLSTIMALLRTRAKFDLRCYKETTLLRRTRRRMGLLGIHSQSEYCDYLREHDDEVRALMKDLLISVTDFFRDPEAWETLEEQAIAPLVKGKGNGEPVRVWIPGSATGEEAFSVAMLLNEQVQGDQKDCPLQIFASDVDKEALEYARQARYPLSIAAEVSPARLKRYFEADGDHHYQIKKNIREAVVFAEQNLVSDPPFSNLDLVCCRNLLIYLKPEIQQKLIALFHFALREGGFLFLGNAETIGSRAELFEIVSKKWRIYRWLDATRHDIIGFPVADQSARRELETIPPAGNRRGSRLSQLAQQRLIDWIAPQAVLIDRRWQILYYCGDTDPFLTHAPGSPTQDVLAKCRQGLRSKLRAAVQRALKDGDTISVQARVKHHRHFEPVRVTARPVRDQENDDTLVLVRFEFESAVPARQAGAAGTEAVAATHDADARQSGRRGADSARRAGAGDTDIDADEVVRQLEEELAETKEDLHTTIEQLEASNEEFKASNEEVMSMNEELQSTNEELETSKEELQSLNEELNTVNSQLASKVDDLERANNDLSNLIRSTEIPTICLDLELRIKWFTPAATSLVRIVASDIGRPLADFSHKLANDNLLPDAQRVLDHLTPIESEVVVQQDSVVASLPTPDGWRTYLRRIVPYRTEDNRIDGVVITLVDISERKRAQALIEVKELAETIIDTVRDPMLVLDSDLNV